MTESRCKACHDCLMSPSVDQEMMRQVGGDLPWLRSVLAPHHTTTTVLRPFLRDHPGEPVPEENFWTLWCKGRLTEADTPTSRLGATPSGLTSVHLHHPPIFIHAGCPSCRLTNSVKALKATSAVLALGVYFSALAGRSSYT